MLFLVEVLVAGEHDLMLCDQLAEMLEVTACEWDGEVESVDDGADRAGETLDVETAGRRGNDACLPSRRRRSVGCAPRTNGDIG
jgi:hypothetical protein